MQSVIITIGVKSFPYEPEGQRCFQRSRQHSHHIHNISIFQNGLKSHILFDLLSLNRSHILWKRVLLSRPIGQFNNSPAVWQTEGQPDSVADRSGKVNKMVFDNLSTKRDSRAMRDMCSHIASVCQCVVWEATGICVPVADRHMRNPADRHRAAAVAVDCSFVSSCHAG